MEFSVHLSDKVDPVAIYAAVISTLVLGWQIYVWLNTGPRLRLSANPNMEMYGGVVPDPNTYTVLKVTNVGRQRTTITHVILLSYSGWWNRLWKRQAKSFIVNHAVSAYPIPHVLEIGETFMSMAIQDGDLVKLSRETLLYMGVHHAFSERAVLVRVPPIQSKEGNK